MYNQSLTRNFEVNDLHALHDDLVRLVAELKGLIREPHLQQGEVGAFLKRCTSSVEFFADILLDEQECTPTVH
jgi:hypothetical protein